VTAQARVNTSGNLSSTTFDAELPFEGMEPRLTTERIELGDRRGGGQLS
jgi:hypothetical protein